MVSIRLIVVFIAFSFFGCKEASKKTDINAASDSKLISLFKTSNKDYPSISVHRGGKGLKGYPENCLETIKYINDSINAIFEVDVAETKDGKLVLLHDNSIDRTTTGTGTIKNVTFNQLQNYRLVDDFGNATTFKVPLFKDVLEWCSKNEIILTVDIKRGVSQRAVVKAIREANAENISIIITYDIPQAKSAHELAPDLLLSVSARNQDELNRLLNSGIPTKNMLAFTGTRLSNRSLYSKLHQKGIICMLGTLGNLDRQAAAKGNHLYSEWLNLGIDILATDRPFEVHQTINKK